MSLNKKIKISVIFSIVFSIIFSTVSFAVTCENIRENVLRLHVLAASDSEEDQRLKLKVRDAILAESSDIFDGSVDMENAVERITPKLSEIQKTAEKVIRENGFDYSVKVSLKEEFFTTRTYDKTTLPAGRYLALRVVIDSGKGHNWWCVMFPALCLPAARANTDIEAVLGEKGTRLVSKNPKYEPRFKVIEIIEEIKNGVR